jgi:lipopolysaccharide assembly protein A
MVPALRNFLIVTLLGLLIVFSVQNVATVEVNFLFWSVALPRAILYVAIFATGVAVGWLARFFGVRSDAA